jgi:hypothetical protein
MIKGRACKIVDMSTSKTGKHGHAKCKFLATDIFDGTKHEKLESSTHNVEVGLSCLPSHIHLPQAAPSLPRARAPSLSLSSRYFETPWVNLLAQLFDTPTRTVRLCVRLRSCSTGPERRPEGVPAH